MVSNIVMSQGVWRATLVGDRFQVTGNCSEELMVASPAVVTVGRWILICVYYLSLITELIARIPSQLVVGESTELTCRSQQGHPAPLVSAHVEVNGQTKDLQVGDIMSLILLYHHDSSLDELPGPVHNIFLLHPSSGGQFIL